jgi:hypothetical protein
MEGSDIIHCQYTFSNNTNVDKFTCSDRYASGRQLPPLDTKRETKDVSTGFSQRYDSGHFYANFEATFDRPVNTGDTVQDKPILPGSMNELIWAFGPMSNANAVVHGATLNERGGLNNFFVMQLPNFSRYLTYRMSLISILLVSFLY